MILQLVVRRLISLVFVLLALSMITFALTHVVPRDSARLIAGPRASESELQQIRAEYGLDQPLHRQYITYMTGVVQLDFGRSMTSRRPVSEDLARYLPASIELALVAIVIAIGFGVPLGVIAAVKRNSAADMFSRVVAIFGQSMPPFWLALIVQFIFFARLGWFPDGQRLPTGTEAPSTITGMYTLDALLNGNFSLFLTAMHHLILPAFVLGFAAMAIVTRMVRSGMLEVMGQDYIRTARAKGLNQGIIIQRHALKNALLPAVTVIGLQIGLLMAGTVLVEIIFSWPGIGRYAYQSIQNFDYRSVISVTLVIGSIYVTLNLLVDIAYILLDPRIKSA
jgi:peptide/nickel transport system permease protein